MKRVTLSSASRLFAFLFTLFLLFLLLVLLFAKFQKHCNNIVIVWAYRRLQIGYTCKTSFHLQPFSLLTAMFVYVYVCAFTLRFQRLYATCYLAFLFSVLVVIVCCM